MEVWGPLKHAHACVEIGSFSFPTNFIPKLVFQGYFQPVGNIPCCAWHLCPLLHHQYLIQVKWEVWLFSGGGGGLMEIRTQTCIFMRVGPARRVPKHQFQHNSAPVQPVCCPIYRLVEFIKKRLLCLCRCLYNYCTKILKISPVFLFFNTWGRSWRSMWRRFVQRWRGWVRMWRATGRRKEAPLGAVRSMKHPSSSNVDWREPSNQHFLCLAQVFTGLLRPFLSSRSVSWGETCETWF